MSDDRTLNRANWDERAPAHAASPDYAVARFAEDPAFLSDVVPRRRAAWPRRRVPASPSSTPTSNNMTHEWNHGLGEIVSAVLDAGLELTALVEHDSVPWPALPGQMHRIEAGSGG